MITIILNGQSHPIQETLSLVDLIESLGLGGKPVIIEYNLEPLHKSQWLQTQIIDGDKLEIITLAAGG